MEKECLDSLLTGPRLGSSSANDDAGAMDGHEVMTVTPQDAAVAAEQERELEQKMKWGSFARVTEVSGYAIQIYICG